MTTDGRRKFNLRISQLSINLFFLYLVSDDEFIIILQSARKPHHQNQNPKHKPTTTRRIPECTTDQCIKQSRNMSQMMDTNVHPCIDFYQYACGGWIAEPLPGDHAKWTIFSYLAEQTENRLKYLIEEQKNSGKKEALMYKPATFARIHLVRVGVNTSRINVI